VWEDEHICQACWDVLPRRVLETQTRYPRKEGIQFRDGLEALDTSAKTCRCCRLITDSLWLQIPMDRILVSSYGIGKFGDRRIVDLLEFATENCLDHGRHIVTRLDCFADLGEHEAKSL
jgi:hypothetical protein